MEDELLLKKDKNNDITDEQKELLYHRVEELRRSNAALLAENDLFERFISRLDPQELVCQAGREGPGEAQVSLEAGAHGWRRRSRSSVSNQLQQLTLEQKLYVAQREIAETQQDKEKLRQRYEKIQDTYKASLEEAELRSSEIRKARNEFERKLLKPMKDNRLEMKEPDKVLKYIEDKSKISQLDKFSQKNQMLKAQEKKLQQQLQRKKEMRKAEYEEVLQDYEEQRIDPNLDEFKVKTLKVKRILSSHKEKLRNATQESTELSNDITNRKLMLAKIEQEIQYVEEERLKAEALNQHLRRQMTDFQAPDITEYIYVKDKHKKLQQSIHNWERKVAIAEMALRIHAKTWNTQRATFTANSAAAEARSADHQMSVRLPNIPQ